MFLVKFLSIFKTFGLWLVSKNKLSFNFYLANGLIELLSVLAKITPNTIDDKILSFIKSTFNSIFYIDNTIDKVAIDSAVTIINMIKDKKIQSVSASYSKHIFKININNVELKYNILKKDIELTELSS